MTAVKPLLLFLFFLISTKSLAQTMSCQSDVPNSGQVLVAKNLSEVTIGKKRFLRCRRVGLQNIILNCRYRNDNTEEKAKILISRSWSWDFTFTTNGCRLLEIKKTPLRRIR